MPAAWLLLPDIVCLWAAAAGKPTDKKAGAGARFRFLLTVTGIHRADSEPFCSAHVIFQL
jgi:hypothetical protein